MSKSNSSLLNKLVIDAPCTVSDEHQVPTQSGSFCMQCSEPVYDLSMMTRAQAQRFLAEREKKLPCIRYTEDDAGEKLFRAPNQAAPANLGARVWSTLTRSTLAATLFAAGCSKPAQVTPPKPDVQAQTSCDGSSTGATKDVGTNVKSATGDTKTKAPDQRIRHVTAGKPAFHRAPVPEPIKPSPTKSADVVE